MSSNIAILINIVDRNKSQFYGQKWLGDSGQIFQREKEDSGWVLNLPN